MFRLFGNSNVSKNESNQKPQKDMSSRERREYERKQKTAEDDREWDHMMDLDTLGFFDN